MLRQALTFLICAAIYLALPLSAHATCAGKPACAIDSDATGALTIGSGGNLSITVDPTSGQATLAQPILLSQETATTNCSATVNYGAIRFNPVTKNFEGCNGSSWSVMGSTGVTKYFSAPLCTTCSGMGGNGSETNYTISLSSYISPLPVDTNYQIICTLVTDGNGAAINIWTKTTTSFVVAVNNAYTNYDNTPTMSVDCFYHHQ